MSARRGLFIALTLGSLLGLVAREARAEQPPPTPSVSWCAPELEALPADVCFRAPKAEQGPRTLIVFLHGLVKEGSDWQHNQQRGFARAADRFGLSVIMPRGRTGASPRNGAQMVAWPTAHTAQQRIEADVLAEWQRARELVEKRDGKPFERVYVMGFSNGAYYATSLAMRGRLDVQGYAVFAGGSGAKHHRRAARAAKRRLPIFVGIAGRDSTARNARQLAGLLRELRWPHRAETRRVGHAVADAHLKHAMDYLTQATAAAKKAPKTAQKREESGSR